jgi:UDP-glucose 4-epimerase
MDQAQEFYKGKNVLVTGGAGFIGSHLVEKLVALGANVTVLDNFATGKLTNLLKVLPYINILYSDICSEFNAIKATKNKDIIFHLAAFISVSESVKYPKLCYEININGTKNLLEGCRINKVPTFIFSSSCAVYGNRDQMCREEDLPTPMSPYAESKLASERLCKEYSKNFGISTACLRYFNVYGERQNPAGNYAAVVARFRYQLLNNMPLTVFGDGTQTRDFINVLQVVDANLLVGTKNFSGDIFNIASGKSINLLELISQLEQELSVKACDISFCPSRAGDIEKSYAQCKKYQKLLES